MGCPSTSADVRTQLADWYASSRTGQALQAQEAAYLKETLRLCYGQHFLQIGALGWERAFWEPDCFRRAWVVDGERGAAIHGRRIVERRIVALADELPVESNSIDLLLMPHTLEFERDHHQVLREAERVLKPEGQLHFLGFNPFSLLGVWRCLSLKQRRVAPGCGRFFTPWRVLDWLSLLKFEAKVTATFSVSAGVCSLPHGMRAMPWFATGYAVRAVKRTYRLIPVSQTASLSARLAHQGVVGPSVRGGFHG